MLAVKAFWSVPLLEQTSKLDDAALEMLHMLHQPDACKHASANAMAKARQEQRSCGVGSNMQLAAAHPLLEDGCRQLIPPPAVQHWLACNRHQLTTLLAWLRSYVTEAYTPWNLSSRQP